MALIKRAKKVMVAITSSDAMICDPLKDLCFPEAHRGAKEGKYPLKPAPEGMHFQETPWDPLTTNHQDLQDILQPGTSTLSPWNPLAEWMESCSCALDPLATQSHYRFLSGSKAKRYTPQLSFKIPRSAAKDLYTMVPEGLDGAGQPVTCLKAGGCLWLS